MSLKITDILQPMEPEFKDFKSFYMSNDGQKDEKLYKINSNRKGSDNISTKDKIILSYYDLASPKDATSRKYVLINYSETTSNNSLTFFNEYKKIDENFTKDIVKFYDNQNCLDELFAHIQKAGKVCEVKELLKNETVLLEKFKEFCGSDCESYLQHIIYGPAGVGKTYSIKDIAYCKLGIKKDDYETQTIHTVFHPEYSYYDFFGKVMPKKLENKLDDIASNLDAVKRTNSMEKISDILLKSAGVKQTDIIYDFYPGPFAQALLQAYENIIKDSKIKDDEQIILSNCPEKVLLVIDELNRGNAAAIFGSLFNLLDRDEHGKSEYPLNIYGMEAEWFYEKIDENGIKILNKYFKKDINKHDEESMKIFIPHNLSIVCTMNTSDETIFTLDKAFERRWNKSFVTAQNSIDTYHYGDIEIENSSSTKWTEFLTKLKEFIIDNAEVDDVDNATIGAYFIKPKKDSNGKYEIKEEDIKHSLMYYIWYDLFNGFKRDTLIEKLGVDFKDIKTFEQFRDESQKFIETIMS